MLRLPVVYAAGFDVRVQEETRVDSKFAHTTKVVYWMAVLGPGVATGKAAQRSAR